MKISPFNVICLRLGSVYKLVLIIHPEAGIVGTKLNFKNLSFVYNQSAKNKAECSIAELIAIWVKECKKNNVIIKEVELILPPRSELLYFDDTFKAFLLKEYGVIFSINIGVEISNPVYFSDKKESAVKLSLLKENDVGQN